MFSIITNIDNLEKRSDYSFEYQAFDIQVCLIPANGFLQIFFGLTAGKGYSDVTIDWNAAVINKNGNRCKVFKYSFTYPDKEKQLRGTDKWIELSKLHTYVNSKREIEIHITVSNCDFKHNESKMIQGIYEKLFGQEEFYLIKYKNTINRLQQEIKRSYEVNEDLNLLLHKALSNDKDSKEAKDVDKSLVSESSSSSSSSSSFSSSSPGTVVDKVKSIDPDILDIETLNNLQESMQNLQIQITKKIKDLETCGVCMENKINCILIPCGHRYCFSCVDTIKKNVDKTKNICPTCRKPITESHKTY